MDSMVMMSNGLPLTSYQLVKTLKAHQYVYLKDYQMKEDQRSTSFTN
jgi:hypothetical protein